MTWRRFGETQQIYYDHMGGSRPRRGLGRLNPRTSRYVERTGGADALPIVSLDHTCRADRVTTSRRW